jgi:WD40 repeat protein
VAFSHDTSLVAVAYRGAPLSVWSIEDSRLIARCRRPVEHRRNGSNRPWNPVDRLAWHPFASEILGVYQDGYVFKWHPYEDHSQQINTAATEIEISTDGNLFATSDTNGCIKLWNYQHLALLYQLTCEYPVADLAFSPDSRRLYDIRGACCNVWEPNALIRISRSMNVEAKP